MSTLANRVCVGLGLIGSLTMTIVLLARWDASEEIIAQFRFCLTLFAASVSVLATCYALGNLDSTGITYEGRVTTLVPIVMAGCGLALTMRWMPERLPFAVAWLVLQLPGMIVGLRTERSTLHQTQRRQQSLEDQRIAIEWELKQLTNRVNLLEQLTQPGGPEPTAQKKLLTTGNSLDKYYRDTHEQLEKFLDQVNDDEQRATALSMQQKLLGFGARIGHPPSQN